MQWVKRMQVGRHEGRHSRAGQVVMAVAVGPSTVNSFGRPDIGERLSIAAGHATAARLLESNVYLGM